MAVGGNVQELGSRFLPQAYREKIVGAKRGVSIQIIASLNCITSMVGHRHCAHSPGSYQDPAGGEA